MGYRHRFQAALTPLLRPVTFFGDSLQAGNVAGPGFQAWYQLGLVGYGCAITNLAVGGTTTAQIAASVPPATAAQKAGLVLIDGGRNDIATTGYGGIVANMQSAVAALSSTDYLFLGMPTGTTDPLGSFNWAQVVDTNRQNQAIHGARFCSIWRFLQTLSDGGAQDTADLASDFTPTSVRTLSDGSVDSLHFGLKGNINLVRSLYQPWVRAKTLGGGYIQPWQEFRLTGTAAATAQTLGGAVCQAPIVGTVDAVAIVAGDAAGDFQVDVTGAITRASSRALTAGRIDLTVEITRNGGKQRGVVRLYIGSADTVPRPVVFDGGSWAIQPSPMVSLDGNKLSGFFCFAPAAGTDGQDLYLWGTETPNAKFVIHRATNNRIAIVARDSTSTNVYSVQSASTGAGLVTAATGEVFVFFSVDLSGSGGAAACKLYVGETSSLSFITATAGATMNLSVRHILGAQTTTGTLPFSGKLRAMWLATSTAIDWSVAANRAAVYNPSTNASVDLGSSGTMTLSGGGTVTPFVYMIGNAADWSYGANLGSQGRFVTAQKPTSVITAG